MTTKFAFNPLSGMFDLITSSLGPGDITGFTPFTWAGFDSTGTLISLPNVSYVENATSNYALQIYKAVPTTCIDVQAIAYDCDLDGQSSCSFVGINSSTDVGQSLPTDIDFFRNFTWLGTFGPNADIQTAYQFADSGNINADAIIGEYVSFETNVAIDSLNINLLRNFQAQCLIGDDDPTHINGYTGIGIFNTFASQADVDSAFSLSLRDNFQSGSVIDGYSVIDINPTIDSIGLNGYRGVEVGANIGQSAAATVNNHIDFQAHPAYRTGSSLGSYNGVSLGPVFESGMVSLGSVQGYYQNLQIDSDTSYVQGYADNTNLGANAATAISNYQGININPNLGASLTLDDFYGITVRPNVQSGAVVTNNFNMLNIGINNPIACNEVVGVDVNLDNFSTGNTQRIGLRINNSASQMSENFDTAVITTPQTVFGLNQMGGQLHIASGNPISGGQFGFGNNLGISIWAEDDMGPDFTTLGLGFSMNGFSTQIAASSGKTFDTLNFMFAGASLADVSTGGTFSIVNMFRTAGVIAFGGPGTASIGELRGFYIDPIFTSLSPTNAWGFRCDDAGAENFFEKSLAIGTSTKQVSNADVAFEIGSLKAIKLPLLTTTQRNALTPLESMFIYNDTTNQIEWYDGSSWVGPGSSAIPLTDSHIFVGNASNIATDVPMSGDIAITNTGATSYAGTVPVNKGGTGQTSYTNGQLLIGNTTGNTLTKTTLTAGSGISITNGAGSITISANNSGYVAPSVQIFTSPGSGTYYPTYAFVVASANATAGAEYTNNGETFTVSKTILGATLLKATGTGLPLSSGTLTLSTGTGDATITFTSYSLPLYIELKMAGGGGGGTGSSTVGDATEGTDGGDTVFGGSTAEGGLHGMQQNNGGGGGGYTLGSELDGIGNTGTSGAPGGSDTGAGARFAGGQGGMTPYFCGGGIAADFQAAGGETAVGFGGGGQGGGAAAVANCVSGSGGGSGGMVDGIISDQAFLIAGVAYTVGALGTAGAAGTGGNPGGGGGNGIIWINEKYQ